jgi:hypothetical protein
MGKKLQIFKPGTHTAMNGQQLTFSEADLLASAAAYNPALHEAPLVIGHPTVDAPAYGWVQKLEFADGTLQADPSQVDAAFADLVKAGSYKKMSASFFLPNAVGNPKPGVYYLRHIGFLGATPPAVKGLKSASFSAEGEGVVEFGDWSDQVELGFWRRLKNFFIGEKGQDTADALFPEYELETLARDAYQPEADGGELSPAYSELQPQETTMTEIELQAQKAALEQQAASFAEREKALAQKEGAQRHVGHVSFADSLIQAGKLLPAQKEQAVAMLDFAAGQPETTTIEFGEGDGKQTLSLSAALTAFLSNQPKIIAFGEVAGHEAEVQTVNFAVAPGYAVEAEGLERHHKALAYQRQHPGTEYMAAVKAVE